MFILILYILGIFVVSVNLTLFVKLFTHPTLKSIFNISHSLHFLLVSLLSPALITVYYLVMTSLLEIDNKSIENMEAIFEDQKTYCSLFFTIRINLIIYGINFSFFNILYRCLYVTIADLGFLTETRNHFQLAHVLYYVVLIFYCCFQFLSHFVNYLGSSGKVEDMMILERICNLASLDFEDPEVFRNMFLKPLGMRLIAIIIYSYFAWRFRRRVRTFQKQHPSSIGGCYRRNFR